MSDIINFPKTKNVKISEAATKFSYDNAEIALREFAKLVDEGCDEAYVFVGAIYEYGGRNVDRDYDKAKFYYEKSIERFGAVEAYLGLIRLYYYGLGVRKDYCKALEYCLLLTEEKNHAYANFLIGKMYMEGYCVDKDLSRAKEFYKKAWDKGYVFGLTYLGILEQRMGNKVKGWLIRIKAGYIAFRIARKNVNDPKIREL